MDRLAFLTAGLILATAASAQDGRHLALEERGARAEITQAPGASPQESTVEVSLTSAGETARWRYPGTWLDPEAPAAPAAELAPAGNATVLLVHAYSGGARCCWYLLAFDVERRAPLGRQVDSEGAIRIVRGEHGCALGAVGIPPKPACRLQAGGRCKPAFFCFDGRRFQEVPGVTPSLRAPERGSPAGPR